MAEADRADTPPSESVAAVTDEDRQPTEMTVAVADEAGLTEKVEPKVKTADVAAKLVEPLSQRPTVRAGVYAWSFIGITIITIGLALVTARLSAVIIPVIIALFPAAGLEPINRRIKAQGVPDALSALITLLGFFGIVTAIVSFIAPAVAEQFDSLEASIREGYRQLDEFLASGPFGLQPVDLNDLIDQATTAVREAAAGGQATDGVVSAFQTVFNTATGILLTLIVLFFYLKDGSAIAEWVKSVFPEFLHEDVDIIGRMGWQTIGGYIQGQLLVAIVDAVFIGIGLVILGVELALPLAVIVFFGGLFPVVGAGISGLLAALVALASNGPTTAVFVIILVLVVQNVEGQLLQPLILGRTLELHPLAIILALTIGGFLLGILGAFLAVPVAAAAAQTVGYLRKRIPG